MNECADLVLEASRLRDENAELRAEIEQLQAEDAISHALLTDAKAEIERLRAALQDLIDRWPTEQGYNGAIKRARKALEGK